MRPNLTLLAVLVSVGPVLVAGCSGSNDVLAGPKAGRTTTPGAADSASPGAPVSPGGAGGSGAVAPSLTPDAGGGADSGLPHAPGTVPGLVAVGYGGLRLASRDAGKTWSGLATAASGNDDFDLLRAVAYANGRWLAVGWKATTSVDGVTWSTPARINEAGVVTWSGAPSCGLVEGLTSDGTFFYAACDDYGQAYKSLRSSDGVTWTELGTIGNLGGHPALAHREGVFYAYGDNGTSYRSTDAVTWSVTPGLVQATFCESQWRSLAACHHASWFGGFYFQAEWQSKVTRSADGATFAVVHDDPSNNTLYQPRAIAEGFVAP
jgi:hypothetical protein